MEFHPYWAKTSVPFPSNIFTWLAVDLSNRVTPLNMSQNIQVIFPNFPNSLCCQKYLKDNRQSSLHLARKCALIFALGHYLFLKVHSFPRASLSENCSLLGTDDRELKQQRRGQCLIKYEFIFTSEICGCLDLSGTVYPGYQRQGRYGGTWL